MSRLERTVTLSLRDWRAVCKLIRQERRALKDSYGLPRRMNATWRREAAAADPAGFKIFEDAERAMGRARGGRR